MSPYLKTDRATLWHARAEEVYSLIDPGSVSMAWVDGPYAMRKAPWDMMKVDDLPAFYAPHYEALDRVLAPSATVYHWGTAEGWARVDPMIRGMGWTLRTLIVWDKVTSPVAIGWAGLTTWAEFTEVAGFYTRGDPPFNPVRGAISNVWTFDHSNDMRDERLYEGTVKTRYGYTGRKALHPCQKPLAFADRAIRASTRPGDTVIDPFAGTNRLALACHRLPPEEARHAHGIEMDARWLDAIRPSLVADYGHVPKGQSALFGAR